jgi:hypothetical protein
MGIMILFITLLMILLFIKYVAPLFINDDVTSKLDDIESINDAYDRVKDIDLYEESLAKRKDGEAKAYTAKLAVDAGLSPQQRAEIDKETAIGVAREIAKIKLPSTMVIGGSGKNGQSLDPFTAIGLKQFLDISKSLTKNNNDIRFFKRI